MLIKNYRTLFTGVYQKPKIYLFVYILLSLISYMLIIIGPLVTAKIIDSAVYSKVITSLINYVIYGIVIQVLFALVMPYKCYLESKIQTEVSINQRIKIISKIPLIRYDIKDKPSIGNLIQLTNEDVTQVKSLFISDFTNFVIQVIYAIIMIYIIIKIELIMFLASIFFTLPLILVSKIMIPQIQEIYRETLKKGEVIKDLTNEVHSGSLVIKLSNSHFFFEGKIKNVLTEYYKIVMKYCKKTIIHNHFFSATIINLGEFLITILGVYMIIQGRITVGTLTIFSSYYNGLWGCFNYFIGFWKSMKEKNVSMERIINYLSLPIDSWDGISGESFVKLEINNISYKINREEILSNISMIIKQRDTILITGDNGSGKTTFVKLLVGLIMPTSGTILYNNIDLEKINQSSLRDRISYIPSEPFIFSGDLENNFFGNDINCNIIDQSKYKDIAKGGTNLSSGEKKRLQLAVGMTRKSDIYILDEPLNFVDENSKKEIVEIIKNELKEKTLIVISHESAPFDFCKHKYSMENGILKRV